MKPGNIGFNENIDFDDEEDEGDVDEDYNEEQVSLEDDTKWDDIVAQETSKAAENEGGQ